MSNCKFCNKPMKTVMSFRVGASEHFTKCPKCGNESKHYSLRTVNLFTEENIKHQNK